MTIHTKGLEAVLIPLIDSMAPSKRLPDCKLCQLIAELIVGELGINMQSELILRFVIHACEEDPEKMWNKLEEIQRKLVVILTNKEAYLDATTEVTDG